MPRNKSKASTRPTHARHTSDGTAAQSRSSPLSFLKSRLFHAGGSSNPSSTIVNDSTRHLDELSSCNASSRTVITSERPYTSIDIPQATSSLGKDDDWRAGRTLSKSFEEKSQQTTTGGSSSKRMFSGMRPVSVMGLPGLVGASSMERGRRRSGSEGQNRKKKRTSSMIVLKEGYLYKKADFRAFHKGSKLDRGWKLYRVVLRGHKLYLYKVSGSSLRSPPVVSRSTSSTDSSRSTVTTYLIRDPVEVLKDVEDLPPHYIYGATFTEHGRSVCCCLLIFARDLVIGAWNENSGTWRIESRVPLHQLQQVEKSTTDDGGFSFALCFHGQRRVFVSQSKEIKDAWLNALTNATDQERQRHRLPSVPQQDGAEEKYDQQLTLDGAQTHHGLQFDNNRIEGGSVKALVHELLFQTRTDRDDTYLEAFLLTYSMFTSGALVLELFEQHARKALQQDDVQVRTSLVMRMLDVFSVWCKRYTQDVVGDVAIGMIKILDIWNESNALDDTVRGHVREVKEVVLDAVRRNGEAGEQAKEASKTAWDENDTSDIETMTASAGDTASDTRPLYVDLSRILITGLTPTIFLKFDCEKFAEQIYLFHLRQHKQHRKALLSPLYYVPRPYISHQVLNSLLFTTSSPHFLTKLIQHQILVDSQQNDMTTSEAANGTVLRTQLLEHWIKVGIALMELGDMTGWCAVAAGICSLGVIRLKESWKAVDRDMVSIVTQKWVDLLADHGFYAQEVQIEEAEKGLATEPLAGIMDVDPSHCCRNTMGLPFFGTLHQAVDRVRKNTQQCQTPEFVPFSRYQSLFDMVQRTLDKWKAEAKEETEDLETYSPPFKPVCHLQAFFDHSVTRFMSVPHDFKYLQECSLACEPRIFGQSFDRRRKFDSLHGTDVAPPSSQTLAFPEVLEGYRLFQPEAQSDSGSHSRMHLRKKASSQSMRSDADEPPRTPHSTTSGRPSDSGELTAHKSPRITNRKMFRRRTYSFPPGGATTEAKRKRSEGGPGYTESSLESFHSKTWLGSLISHRQGSYSAKVLLDAVQRKDKHHGEWLLVLEKGDLILKASTLVQSDDSVTMRALKSTSSGFLALTEKGSAGIRSRSGTLTSTQEPTKKKDGEDSSESSKQNSAPPMYVNVKSGLLERLVDVLVHGVSRYSQEMREQWHLSALFRDENKQLVPQQLAIDDEEYVSAFFVTYRSFCSCPRLLELLRNKFVEAKSIGKIAKQQKISPLESVFKSGTEREVDQYDWATVASVQTRVLNLMMYWMEEHFYDFVDEIEILNHVGRFLKEAQEAVEQWPRQSDEQTSVGEETRAVSAMAESINRQLQELKSQFIRKILSPSYDLKAIYYDAECNRKVDELYHQLTSSGQSFTAALQKGVNMPMAFSLVSEVTQGAESLTDQQAPSTLLQQADFCVRQLFASVTLQDWIQTFDVFEAQSSDLYAWLPARKASQTPPMSCALSPVRDAPSAQQTSYHVAPDEVVVSDIFTAIEGARRSIVSPSAFSADDLLLAFPSSIQYLYCMHFIIRSWVICEITSKSIDLKTRVRRIDTFLRAMVVSKVATERMALFPELREVEDRPRRVPGFVEYAIASALISPEVRLFSKAWLEVAHRYGEMQVDTLENLLSQVQRAMQNSGLLSAIVAEDHQVPSIGWIFDRMLELCAAVPDTYSQREHMINFDKRRYVFHFLQLVMNAQVDLQESEGIGDRARNSVFVISPNGEKGTWKDLKEYAMRENRGGAGGTASVPSSSVVRGATHKVQGTKIMMFGKLVSEQLDKLKRDIKERDRIDKDWRDLQHKLQKRQVEQAKYQKKQKQRSHRHANQYHHLPKLHSLFRGLKQQPPLSSLGSAENDTLSTARASTVINLIHSTTSVASAYYTKRDHVFRIVTEEGGQYLFQGVNREDMLDWMQQINNAAREGAVKRQSVLMAESSSTLDDKNQQSCVPDDATSLQQQQPKTRTSVYGVELSVLMENGSIPLIVEKCIQEIERRGLEEVGIYRIAGMGSAVEELKKAFNTDVASVDLSDPKWADINVVADALKQFLRNIPGSLLTHTYYDEFIHASGKCVTSSWTKTLLSHGF